ncbi:MAG: acylphosphatase [Sedimenticola sp.]
MSICLRCLVSGKVQGVFFRATARFEAQTLGIKGYAKNLTDGNVEVMACGEPDSLEKFRYWLSKGPQAARVSGVSCESVGMQLFDGFSVR